MHFMRRKRDPCKNLIFIVNIGGAEVKVKKDKALSARYINRSKNNIIATRVPSSKEERNSI